MPGSSSSATTDAGASWHSFATDYVQAAGVPPQIVFGDAQTGYATVRGGIQRTSDGGVHWTFPGVLQNGVFRSDPVTNSDEVGNFFYLSLQSDVNQSFFCDDLWRSTNGGQTWVERSPDRGAGGGDK